MPVVAEPESSLDPSAINDDRGNSPELPLNKEVQNGKPKNSNQN